MNAFRELLFGPGGIPGSAKGRGTAEGVREVKKLGLGAMELEFVRGVNLSREKAAEVAEARRETGVVLTAHGPYYINLNSSDPAKRKASVERILKTARIAHACGAWSITFHAAYYQKTPAERVYNTVKKSLEGIVKRLQDEGVRVWIRPEVSGKPSQFGSLEEIIRLSQDLEMVAPCIDFAHLHARTNGRYNSREEWEQVLDLVEKELGKQALKQMHVHLSGIEYSEKGERNHLMLDDSDLKWKELFRVWKEYKIAGCVISETPDPTEGALQMQREWERMK